MLIFADYKETAVIKWFRLMYTCEWLQLSICIYLYKFQLTYRNSSTGREEQEK